MESNAGVHPLFRKAVWTVASSELLGSSDCNSFCIRLAFWFRTGKHITLKEKSIPAIARMLAAARRANVLFSIKFVRHLAKGWKHRYPDSWLNSGQEYYYPSQATSDRCSCTGFVSVAGHPHRLPSDVAASCWLPTSSQPNPQTAGPPSIKRRICVSQEPAFVQNRHRQCVGPGYRPTALRSR